MSPPSTPLIRSLLSASPSEKAKSGPDPASDDAIVDATLKAEAKRSGPAQTACDGKVEEAIEVEEKKESASAQKTDVIIVEDLLEPEPKEPKKEPKAARKAKEAIIDEPLKSELIIAMDRQNFRNGVYKSIIKDMKSPISALNTILYCRKLEREERVAIQEYHDEAVSIYEGFENGEKDVSEFISQETWDSLMEVFLADARKRQSGIATRTVKIYDDDEKVGGLATIYRDDTYDFWRQFKHGEDGRESDEAKWVAAVKFLEEELTRKGLKKRTKNCSHGERAEYHTALRLELEP